MKKNIRRYKVRVLFAEFVSAWIALLGIAAALAYFEPAWLGMPEDQSKLYKGKVIWLLAGLFFVALGLTFMVVAFRRSRRSLWVVANASPVEMLLTLEVNEDSDSTTYYAQLRDLHSAKARWRAWVDPTFKARSMVGLEVPAQVFIDPTSGAPAAIKVEQGMLWANPYASSQPSHRQVN